MFDYKEAMASSLEYFTGDQMAADVFVKKYALRDKENNILEKNPDDMHRRLAREFARIEKKYSNPLSEDEIYELFKNFARIVPQGSPMSGIGNDYRLQSLSNCFVIPSPVDSYGGICYADQQLTQIMKRRGGVGLDMSNIRPKGLATDNAAQTTDGIAVFMEKYSNTCREVAQGGRRGALMLTIDIRHPEIETFINIKRDLKKVTGANISIRVTDEFMRAVENDDEFMLRWPVDDKAPIVTRSVKAKDIWVQMMDAAWTSAEPGILFWDTATKNTPADAYKDFGFGSISTNPCLTGETLIAVADGRGQVSIKELAAQGLDVPVYACDKDGQSVIKMMRNPRVTGFNKPIYKVTIEGGHQIRCTQNHKFRLLDGSYKEASNLLPGEQLHVSFIAEAKFLEVHKGLHASQSQDYIWIKQNKGWKAEHRMIWEFNAKQKIEPGFVIHHNDFDAKNNRYDNLRLMSKSSHDELHTLSMFGDSNPMRRAKTEWSDEKWASYKKNMSNAVSGFKNGRAFNITNDELKEHAINLTKSLGRRYSCNEWEKYAKENQLPCFISKWRIQDIGTSFDLSFWAANECGYNEYAHLDTRIQRTLIDAVNQGYDARVDGVHVKVKRTCERCGNAFENLYQLRERAFCGVSCSNHYLNEMTDVDERRTKAINDVYKKKGEKNKKKILDIFTELKFKLGRHPKQQEVAEICKERKVSLRLKTKYGFQSWQEVKDTAAEYNHRVISVELDGHEDVYNGTVDDVHNFYTCVGSEINEKFSKPVKLLINSLNCGEIILSAYDSCRLLLINLSSYVVNSFTRTAKFDFDSFSKDCVLAQRLMDDLVDLEVEAIDKIIAKVKSDKHSVRIKQIELDLWNSVKETALNGRRTGLGVTALGDALAHLNVRYASDEAINLTEEMYRALALAAHKSSVIMAAERGPFQVYHKGQWDDNEFMNRLNEASDAETQALFKLYGRRNICLTTTAPAGSVSALTQTTSGIEPVFSLSYTRRRKLTQNDVNARVDFIDDMGDKWQEYIVYHHGVKKWMEATGDDDIKNSPYYGSTSADIDWERSVDMQAAAQRWIEHSISKTCNLPESATKELVSDVYMRAWKKGCKGFTIYRAGSRAGVLIENDDKKQKQDDKKSNDRPKELHCKIHHMQVKGEAWTVLVGLKDDRPYEIFGGLSSQIEVLKKYGEGIIIKNSRKTMNSTYDLRLGNGEGFLIKNIVEQFDNPNQSATTRLISLILRHGASIELVVEQLQKDKNADMFSFSKCISRVLKSYIKDGTSVKGKTCPNCSSTSLAYIEGCMTCTKCSWSKCS